jgi:hypothetical protein
VVSTEQREYIDYRIKFICPTEDFAEYIAKCPGAPAHDNNPSHEEILDRIQQGPESQVWTGGNASDEHRFKEISATRRTDGTMEVQVALTDLDH